MQNAFFDEDKQEFVKTFFDESSIEKSHVAQIKAIL